MTPAHHIKTILTEDGKLSFDQLPFRAGHAVEVIVLAINQPVSGDHPLKGTVIRFDDPTAPVAISD